MTDKAVPGRHELEEEKIDFHGQESLFRMKTGGELQQDRAAGGSVCSALQSKGDHGGHGCCLWLFLQCDGG